MGGFFGVAREDRHGAKARGQTLYVFGPSVTAVQCGKRSEEQWTGRRHHIHRPHRASLLLQEMGSSNRCA